MNSIYQKLLRKPRTIGSWSYSCTLFIFALLFCFRADAATYPVTNTNDAGAGSLRQAIIDANANAGADIIDATGINGTISLLSLLPNISESVTINGPGMLLLTINQTIDRRVFTTNTGAITFVLQNLTLNFTGPGTVPYSGGGGAIITGGAGASTTVTNVKISNFRYQIGNGGAISQSSSLNTHNLTITNCIFENNRCGGAGGAVSYNGLGTVSITGCTFTGNQTGPVGLNTGGDGGALSTTGGGNGGTYLVEKNTFIGNQVLNNTGHAGAVINTNGTLTLRFNRFVGNTCANVAFPPLANVIAQTGGSTVNTTIADNNWWGVNTGPGANDAVALAAGATLTLTKWLQLKTTASPNPICATNPSNLGITTTVTTSFLSNSASEAIAVGNLPVLIGLPVTWGPTTLGSLSGSQATIQANGTATATFTSNGTGGNATVNTVVDNIPNNDATARATIVVNTSPTVTTPANQIVCAGSTAMFTATVTGMPAPTIKWYNGATLLENGVKYSGATTNTLSISNAQLSDVSSTYHLVVSNACSTVTSGNASLTVNIPSVAPTSISGVATFCNPGTTTLTATGGTLGTGANYQWGTGAVVGTSPLVGETNATLIVSPTSSSTYWVRIENTTAPCPANTSGVTQLVTVNQPSVAPTGATGTTTICAGESTTLTVNGGSAGTGAIAQWFIGSCGGTAAGTGNSITVSPTTTTTYYVRYSGTCNTTTCATVAVTVNTLSVAPTGATGITTICTGESTTLTVDGGSAGTGAIAQWFTGSCGGTPAGTGNSIVVSPTTNTTYYVRYSGICNTTNCATVTVNSSLALPSQATAQTKNLSPGNTAVFEVNCKRIAKVLSGGNQPVAGNVEASVWIQPQPIVYGTKTLVSRHYQLVAVDNPQQATGTITLYFLQQEFDAFNATPNHGPNLPTGPNDIGGIANFAILKYPGSSNNGTGLPGTYSGNPVLIEANDIIMQWNTTYAWWEVSFANTGFSGFFGGNINPVILPLNNLLTFTAQREGKSGLLRWTTTPAHPFESFEVQKSTDGVQFTPLTTLAGTPILVQYQAYDHNLQPGMQYYRLRIREKDGTVLHSEVRSLKGEGEQIVSKVYPIPVVKGRTLTIVSNGGKLLSWRLYHTDGRVITARDNILENSFTTSMQVPATLANGIYLLVVKTDKGMEVHKVMVE